MITLDAEIGMRRGRIFACDDVQTIDELRSLDTVVDSDDEVRWSLLHNALQRGFVHGVAHPGVDLADVMDIYISSHDVEQPLFACVIVSTERLRSMLTEASVVIEDTCLQVAEKSPLTPSVIASALEVWAYRNFPGAAVPQFNVQLWADDSNDPDAVLFAELLAGNMMAEELAVEHELNSIVERPWSEAA